jgi:hypothetical protein
LVSGSPPWSPAKPLALPRGGPLHSAPSARFSCPSWWSDYPFPSKELFKPSPSFDFSQEIWPFP